MLWKVTTPAATPAAASARISRIVGMMYFRKGSGRVGPRNAGKEARPTEAVALPHVSATGRWPAEWRARLAERPGDRRSKRATGKSRGCFFRPARVRARSRRADRGRRTATHARRRCIAAFPRKSRRSRADAGSWWNVADRSFTARRFANGAAPQRFEAVLAIAAVKPARRRQVVKKRGGFGSSMGKNLVHGKSCWLKLWNERGVSGARAQLTGNHNNSVQKRRTSS